jgi:peptide deformylase
MKLVDELNPTLRKRTPAFSFQDSLLADRQKLVEEMFEIMTANNGIGLAAPQVGISARFFVMASTQYGNLVCYNPEIAEQSEELAGGIEGCLSFPDLQLPVKRATVITGKFEDINGNVVSMKFEGIDARCFLHELDHLDGIVFTTKVGPATLQIARQRQSKLKRTKRQ